PLASMCVAALNASTGSQLGFTTTNASGQYTISALPSGSYKVEFTDCSGAGYLPQYYNGKPSFATATPVALEAPATVSGINAKMALGAKITGTVTNNAASPAPLGKMCVYALSTPGLVTASATTNESGQYAIRPLPTGSYRIEVSDCKGTDYITQYYSNKSNFSTANPVSVTAPAVTSGINVKLVLG